MNDNPDRLVIHYSPGNNSAGSKLKAQTKMVSERETGSNEQVGDWDRRHLAARRRIALPKSSNSMARRRRFRSQVSSFSITLVCTDSFYYQCIIANHDNAGLPSPACEQPVGAPDALAHIVQFPLDLISWHLRFHAHSRKWPWASRHWQPANLPIRTRKGLYFAAQHRHIHIDGVVYYIDFVFHNFILVNKNGKYIGAS